MWNEGGGAPVMGDQLTGPQQQELLSLLMTRLCSQLQACVIIESSQEIMGQYAYQRIAYLMHTVSQ